MSGDTYPKLRLASVQAAPVFLNREATIEKVARMTAEAKQNGADLVVFPESYIPTYPVWCLLLAPIDQHELFERLFANSVMVPSPAFSSLQEIARSNQIFLSVGVTEKEDYSMGAMWNTNILLDRDGNLLNKHRKLKPTWAEKLVWADGDGSSLKVSDTEIGRIGCLICGENTNTLARYSLVAQGEQIHLATYPPCWPTKRPKEGAAATAGGGYNAGEITRMRAGAHCFEGKLFTAASSGVLDQDAIDQICFYDERLRPMLESVFPAASMIVGPDSNVVPGGGPLIEEGIVYADIDIAIETHLKGIHDIVGSYQRLDVFQVFVNQTPQSPATFYTNDRMKMTPASSFVSDEPVEDVEE